MHKPYVYLSLLILALLTLAACAPAPEPSPETEAALLGPGGSNTPRPPGPKSPTPPPATHTPSSTPTPTATQTPTATPTPAGCPPHGNDWHAPTDEPCSRHHHGVNPRDYADVFSIDGFDLDGYLDQYGELRQPWETSVNEEWTGYIWLYEEDLTCEQYAPQSNLELWKEWDCVVSVLLRIHDTGTAPHFLKRFHSQTIIVKGCDKGPDGLPIISAETCGVFAHGGHQDYGPAETPYKRAHCPIVGVDPPDFFSLDQPPYRASTIIDPLDPDHLVIQFWSGQAPGPINNPALAWYPHRPNGLVGVGWSSVDAWQQFDPAICGQDLATMQALAEEFPVQEGNQHVTFQIFNIRILAHPAGPFVGWTDQHGHLWPDGVCSAASPSCIPLIITEHFPGRRLILQRRVQQGDCDFAPCLVIDTGGVEMVYPSQDVP